MSILAHPLSALTAAFAVLGAATCTAYAATPAGTCMAQGAATAPPVVELYTSEGCSSCPPADRWLSKLKTDPSVVALAFHVDYWDRLGWKDRFASAAYTERQAQQQKTSGARFSYTPQVILDGIDRPDWPRADVERAGTKAAPVGVTLTRDTGSPNRFDASITPGAATPSHLAAYWAVTEQSYVSAVRAGENEGATLAHDFVVREYRPVAAWTAHAGTASELRFEPAGAVDPAHPRTVNLVILDADTGRPIQAVKLGC